jgi:hypothetical protein
MSLNEKSKESTMNGPLPPPIAMQKSKDKLQHEDKVERSIQVRYAGGESSLWWTRKKSCMSGEMISMGTPILYVGIHELQQFTESVSDSTKDANSPLAIAYFIYHLNSSTDLGPHVLFQKKINYMKSILHQPVGIVSLPVILSDIETKIVQTIQNTDTTHLKAQYPNMNLNSKDVNDVIKTNQSDIPKQVGEMKQLLNVNMRVSQNWITQQTLGYGIYQWIPCIRTTKTHDNANCCLLFEENGSYYLYATSEIKDGTELVLYEGTEYMDDEEKEMFQVIRRYFQNGGVITGGVTGYLPTIDSLTHIMDRYQTLHLSSNTWNRYPFYLRMQLFRFMIKFVPHHQYIIDFLNARRRGRKMNRGEADGVTSNTDEDIDEFGDEKSPIYQFVTEYSDLLSPHMKDSHVLLSTMMSCLPVGNMPFYENVWHHPKNGFVVLNKKLGDEMMRNDTGLLNEADYPANTKRLLE